MSKIYFFNGWAMDQNLLSPLKNSTEYEIKVINFPYNIDKTSINKEDIFIAYSFGVYYLNKFLSESQDLVYEKAIAINGLPKTIGKFGINEKMFNMTLETLDKENLEKFLKSMRRKYFHSIQLCYAILHKRQSSMEKIGNALASVLSEPQRICLVLVVKEYEAAWCVQMKDTLAVALKDILRIWKAEVLVLSEEMARKHSIIA